MITVRVDGYWSAIPIPENYRIDNGPCNSKEQDFAVFEFPISVIGYYLTILETAGFHFTVSGGS